MRLFASPSNLAPAYLLNQHEQFICVQTIFRTYYAIIFFLSFTSWRSYLKTTNIEPLWPLYWFEYTGIDFGIKVVSLLYFAACLLVVIFPGWRISRIVAFLGLLEFRAVANSFGKINHSGHLAILLSFILIFLPYKWLSKNVSKYVRTATLLVFSGCQALIMMTYTMAGVGKLVGALFQSIRGEIHALDPQGLPLILAERILKNGGENFLNSFLINNYYVTWLLMLGTVYLQFFSLWAAFRPRLHQIWGLGLILFHISTSLTMDINFPENILWLAIFFLGSPFRPESFSGRQLLQDLPLISRILHLTKVIKKTDKNSNLT